MVILCTALSSTNFPRQFLITSLTTPYKVRLNYSLLCTNREMRFDLYAVFKFAITLQLAGKINVFASANSLILPRDHHSASVSYIYVLRPVYLAVFVFREDYSLTRINIPHVP